jgi:hypothetical protein
MVMSPTSHPGLNRNFSKISSRQSISPSFFPQDDEPDYGFSSVDPQSLYQVTASYTVANDEQAVYPPLKPIGEKRQGLVFDESPPGVSTFQSTGSGFGPSGASSSSSFQSSLSEPFYQNFATPSSPTVPGSSINNYQTSSYPGSYPQRPQKYSGKYPKGPPSKYPSRYQSSYPPGYSGKYPPNYYPSPSQYASNYPSQSSYPSQYNYQFSSPSTNYPSQAASSNYPNYYTPNRYATQNPNYYYQQTGTNPGVQQQQQALTAAQQHASLYSPNKNSPYPYYQPNYAHQYGNYRPTQRPAPSGFSGILNSIQNGQIGSIGGQFSKALEDISANDDLLCVPKLVCQMIGNPRRQSQLPSFMNSPAITA